jgi:type I restriction enzyme S subunit
MKGNGLDTTSVRRWRRYPAYRACQADWLREVPEHWKVERLKWTVAACQNGAWGTEPDGGPDDIACVRVADFDRTRFVVPSGVDFTIRAVPAAQRKGKMLQRGDLLLEKSGGGELQPVGVVMLYDADTPAVCSNFIARMPVAVGQDPSFHRYLHAALYSGRLNTRSINQSTGIQNLDASAYLTEFAPFPPLSEQRAIAAFLDRETARIEALIEKKERLIALLEEKRQAIVSQAVTRGLDSGTPTKESGAPFLGIIPASWEVKALGFVLRYISYGFTNPMPIADEGPYLLTANDIGEGRILYETARHTTAEAFQTLLTNKSRPQKGAILLTKDGTLGRTAICDGAQVCINQSVAVLRVNTAAASVDYVHDALQAHPYQERIALDAGGTAIKHVYITRLAKMPIAVPPKHEQESISRYCMRCRTELGTLIEKIQGGIVRLQEYRTALISAAVTGQIDVRQEAAP